MAIVDGHIRCNGCKQTLPLAAFPPSAVKRGNGKCGPCSAKVTADRRAADPEGTRAYQRANSRRWYANNRDVHNARTQRYYQHDPERSFGRHLQRTYGISLDDYNRLLAAQDGGCAVCGKKQGVEKLRLGVDHDHVTGRIRGLLCHECNRALGKFGDSIEGVKRVLAYLERAQQQPPMRAAPSMRINLLGAN